MNTSNKVLMTQARESLKGKWKFAVKVTFVYAIIQLVVQAIPLLGGIAAFIIAGPFYLGLASFWLAFIRNEDPKLNKIFEGFDTWTRSFKVFLIRTAYVFLWSFLLIIPGIIASLSYSQVYFILSEDKENLSTQQILKKSKAMMKGNKWKLVKLHLRFIGWGLLCILTLGIGFLWLTPYVYATLAKFYEDIKENGQSPNQTIAQ